MTLDAELVTRKLMLVVSDLDTLRPIVEKGLNTYLESRIDQAVVERLLERAIGRMIDVNYHIITESGQAPPTDYHASFTRLAELGVLEGSFAQRIARAAGLRNRIVHEYEALDPARVFEGLAAAMTDIPQYARGVNDYVARTTGRPST